jgi:Meiotically up-regulated gene 113
LEYINLIEIRKKFEGCDRAKLPPDKFLNTLWIKQLGEQLAEERGIPWRIVRSSTTANRGCTAVLSPIANLYKDWLQNTPISKLKAKVQIGKASNCIYLVKCERYYKIGVAANLNNRLSTMRNDNPFDIELIDSVFTNDFAAIEVKLHNRFAAQLHRNEWYLLSKDDVEGILELFQAIRLKQLSKYGIK